MSERNWKEYNEKLVRRGEVLFDFDFLEKWGVELEEMNKGKRGKNYRYPDSYIRFLAFLYVFYGLPYRQLEGFIKALKKINTRLKKPDHATMHRRITKLNLNLDDTLKKKDKPITIAVDSSGIKVTNRGEWIREKWNKTKRKGYLKIHFAVDTKSKQITAMEVTDEKTGDTKKFRDLVEKSSKTQNVEKVLADGSYDSKKNYNYLNKKKIKPGIKPRNNSSTKSKGSLSRKKQVIQLKKLGYEKWKEFIGYGQRWSVESAFSTFKRIFGEHVRAVDFENMVKEIELKVMVYNIFVNC